MEIVRCGLTGPVQDYRLMTVEERGTGYFKYSIVKRWDSSVLGQQNIIYLSLGLTTSRN